MVNMKILDLPLKAKWYEMIESGNKKEEYREIKKYWIGRLAKCGGRNSYEKTGFYCKKGICFSCITRGNGFHPKEYTHVRFRFGYTKRTMLFELESITIGVGNTNWGAPDNECVFILKLGKCIKKNESKKSKSRRFLPHCQPFRDLNNPHQIIPQWQKDMAHWADRKEIYMSCDFKDFSPRKGFLCKEYFKIL